MFLVAVFGQMDFHDSTFEGDSMIRVPEKVRIERRVWRIAFTNLKGGERKHLRLVIEVNLSKTKEI